MRFLSFILFMFIFSCQRGEIKKYTSYLNHNDTVRYVGKEKCKICHAEIYESYMQTGMGQSFHFATKEHSALKSSNMPLIHDTIKNLSYKPYWKNDSLYLLEFRLKGRDTIHQLVKKVTYKIGSGHHTNSHLFELNGYLHQIPYTYYTQNNIGGLPPGFEGKENSRFSRKIGLECITCHNAYPNHDTGSLNKYTSMPSGIDCERCHGPGELHVKQKLAGNIIDTSKYIDYSIVNPARLPLDLQFDICQRCHLQGTAILNDLASFTDFKPGMHLKDVMDIYVSKYEGNNNFIMASHVDRLKQSKCFKNSELTCISCHNPHENIKTLEQSYFDNKCMNCHSICKDEKKQDCTKCHMPTSSSSDIPHITITDHNISIPKGNKKKLNKIFKGLVSINNDKPTNLSKAKAYLKHFESFDSKPIYLDSALYYLKRSQNNFTSYIQYYYLKNDNYTLLNYFSTYDTTQLIKYTNNELSMAFSRIAEAFKEKNKIKQAIQYHSKAIALSPFILDYKIKLAVIYIQQSETHQAALLLNQVLELYPENKEALLNLGFISILEKEYKKAENYLLEAIKYDPDYIKAYENLVLLRIQENNNPSTIFYLNKILEIAPSNVNAQYMLDKITN